VHRSKDVGCIVLERGTCADVVDQQEQSTEIVAATRGLVRAMSPFGT
jgi:hypothetical protein